MSTWHDGLVALDPVAESGRLGQLSYNRIGHHSGVSDDIEETMIIGRLSNDLGYSLTKRRIIQRIRAPPSQIRSLGLEKQGVPTINSSLSDIARLY